MHSSDDDDLPDVFGGNYSAQDLLVKAPRLKIDVDFEIQQSLNRKETQRRIAAEVKKFETVLPEPPKDHPIKQPRITAYPASRSIFHQDRSLKSFNSDSLSLKQSCPTDYQVLAPENWVEFFKWLRIRVQIVPPKQQQPILLFLWCMQSVNPDQHIIFKCHDLLLELNHSWRLKWEEVILLFWNWGAATTDVANLRTSAFVLGAATTDFVSDRNVEGIVAKLEARELVTPYNIECALNILKEQLHCGDLDGDKNFKKTVFILLSLLSLDFKYSSSVYAVQYCLEAYETLPNSETWVCEYSEDLLKVEPNHARVAYLAQCILPVCVRRCLSFAFLLSMLSLKPVYAENPEPASLRDLLKTYWKSLLQWDSYEIHSFVTLVDCVVADYITIDTEKEIRSDLLLWLRDLSQALRFSAKDELDVDATVLCELLSRLQTEYEECWPDITECEEFFNDVLEDGPSSDDSNMSDN